MNSLTRFANSLSKSSAHLSKITTSSAVTASVCSQQRRGFLRLRRSSYALSSQELWRTSRSFKNNEASLLWGTSKGKWIVTSPVIKADAEMVDVTFVRPDGSKIKTKGKIGDNMLDVVVNNNVDLDGYGACEGTLACSTCHLVFKKQDFDKIQEKLTDEEMDMLDMAYGLTDTSRLGCQVCLTKDLDGVEVEVPAGVSDARN